MNLKADPLAEPTTVDRHILALRRQGVSYRSIAIAVNHFTAITVTENYARRRARQLGAPRIESKVRA